MTSEVWIWVALAVVALLLAAGLGYAVWRRRGSSLDRLLNEVALRKLQHVLLPDGMGGQIQLEYLLLTAQGLVVIDVKPIEGVVFASDRMTEWTVIGQRGRFTFPNPQGTLYDRVAALRLLVRDVPVAGYVLFGNGADFSKGRPRDVILPRELAEWHAKPDRGEIERLLQSYLPHWEQVRAAAQPAS
ncbi:MAG TPA: nuclease-related domain-containing protein [Gammaproteobacteria bacterium]